MGIQSDGDVVDHVSLGHECLKTRQTWSLADDGLTVNDGSVHPSGSIEDTEGSVPTHVDEVSTLDCDLGSSIGWTARWLDTENLWGLIIEEWKSI